MDQNQNPPLFGLSIDPITKGHLGETARWAKFLAIIGFISCALIVLVGIFAGSFLGMYSNSYEGFDRDTRVSTRGFGAIMAVFYVLLAVLYFFPCLFLFNFASKMKSAILSDDQDILNSSFLNLKRTFRYVGILTIILLSLYLVIFLFAIVARSTV